MTDERFEHIVAEVVRRLNERLGYAGGKGTLVVVFTAATVAFGAAMRQLRSLLLDGYRTQLAFSPAAEHLLGDAVMKQLDGFTGVSRIQPGGWLSSLKEAKAVAAPMVSLNTVSKLCSLMADNLAGNLLLHGLLMGKPVILARDGADPDGEGRRELGFDRANEAVKRAMRQRLRTLQEYGCTLTGAETLADAVRSVTAAGEAATGAVPFEPPARSTRRASDRIATAGDVLDAHRRGASLSLSQGRMTPLARDLARQLGVSLTAHE